MRKEIRIRILLKTPLGGVPPPLVFDFGRSVAWKEGLKDCVVKLGFLVKSQVIRWVSSDSGRSWAGPGLLLGILVGFWEALGLSWAAPGLLLGRLGHSWAVLGGSWKFLGSSWAAPGLLLGALGRLWDALGRQVGAKWGPKKRKVEPKTLQNRG